MIYLDIVGRCGNQMFQYAFSKKISIVNDNEEIIIDFYHVYEEARKRDDVSFKNELKNFKARNCFVEINEGGNKIYKYGSRKQVLIFKIYKKIRKMLLKFSHDKRITEKLLYKIMSRYGIYWYYAPEKFVKCKEKNKFVWGYFENPAYFDDIRDELLKDFTPVFPITEKNIELYKIIKKENSICVSIRKWENNEPIDNNWIVCNENYYNNAISILLSTIPNGKLIIFSNNISWVKQKFSFPEGTIYETGDDPVYEKLRLMYSCNHFILSNSTFAWWTQYLGEYGTKLVMAPECWHKLEKQENPLLQNYFRKVSI